MASSKRLDDISNDDLLDIVNSCNSKRTENANSHARKLFNNFLVQCTDIGVTIESISKEELIKVLPRFYASVKTQKSERYTAVSMLCIRSSLNRVIASQHLPSFNIITDPDFQSANRVLKAILKKIRAEGKGKIQHKPAITEEDMQRLYRHATALSIDSAQGLSNRIYVELSLYFCRRGSENLASLLKDDFAVKTDSRGIRFVMKTTSESDKNHQGAEVERSETEGGRMYATGGPECPVRSFEKYISKLNQKCARLFQKPKSRHFPSDETWFENKPLGINSLMTKMSQLSEESGLSRRYTNHCLRATSITILSKAGFEARHIRTISGHKSDSSLDSYVRETTDTQKQSMSSAITSHANSRSANTSAVSPRASNDSGNQGSNSAVAQPTFNIFPEGEDFEQGATNLHVSLQKSTLHTTTRPVWNIQATNVQIHNHYH